MDVYRLAAEDLELAEELRRADLAVRLAEGYLEDRRREREEIERRMARARLKARASIGMGGGR